MSADVTLTLKMVRREVWVPHWFLVVLFGFWPTLRFIRWRRHRRRQNDSKCLVCGYDLRASPDKCPECGTPVSSSHGRTANETTPTPSTDPLTPPAAPPPGD